tara:strand:+ start:327 stop:578 length:252 start_codon:yes stop_codon:yes gene_type:complete
MLHSLIRTGELSVGSLADEAQMSRQAASNQLRTLADAGVVTGRQEGLKVFYRVIDPCVPVLLERGWCHIDEYDTVLEEGIVSD